jgi:amino acid transporter
MQEAHTALAAWESYYVIIGSSGAALTGLQFVVLALAADSPIESSSREISAFGTPTVVHFCSALLISALLSAPWHSLTSVSVALGVCGLLGVIYGCVTIRRARLSKYQPVWQDWLWHTVLPMLAYAFLLVSAVLLPRYPERALFLVAAVALLLLFIGIHNSWDTVTYIASGEFKSEPTASPDATAVEASGPTNEPKQQA